MKKLVFAMLLYLSLVPLIGAGAFAFGYFYSAGVELYYFNNPVEDVEDMKDFDEAANAEYLM